MPLDAPYILPPTPKQVDFANVIATRLNTRIPVDATTDRRVLSEWIDQHKSKSSSPRNANGQATSKQVAFAERIARIKRRTVPQECFRDMGMMSRWINANR